MQQPKKVGGGITVCMLQLEHAAAEYLASVLEPFLSPEGRIAPYKTGNTLIIKDRTPMVNILAEVIKGKLCTPIAHPPEAETDLQQEGTLSRPLIFPLPPTLKLQRDKPPRQAEAKP